ncbi:hypothetical protein BDA99DRAFT_536273 [Phascolomyces articulosus]|uniref:Uncharacterized protein n=1 Tax=Phascolomyces articulosus TaxID=60185 RepID=A0AAD5K383_9FUNG|nr:hypothetical protein BDA99DRAFT_536273 [Phascolomyces articulosus]
MHLDSFLPDDLLKLASFNNEAKFKDMYLDFSTVILHYQVHSYCIYNKAEQFNYLDVTQIGGAERGPKSRRFRQLGVYPGTKVCCPYNNHKGCSDIAAVNHPVQFSFDLWHLHPDVYAHYVIEGGVAGGYIIFSGTVESPKFEVFNADHQVIPFQLR